MPDRDSYPEGAPCWADVMSHDAQAAGQFYRAVFGWDLEDMGPEYGHYTVATMDGKMIAAISPPPPDGDSLPPAWTVYLKSTDVAGTAQMVEKAGGTVAMPPMEVPTQGHMMLATDPTGATFGVWQPGGHNGAQLFNEDGAMIWAELHTRGGAAADAFYEQVFPLTGRSMGDLGMEYTMFKSGDDMVAGRAELGPEQSAVPPHWLVYFQVPDTDAAVAKIRELGGTVSLEPQDTSYGRMAFVADPAGARFAVIKPPTE